MNNIMKLRTALGLSQDELAERANIPLTALQDFEQDRVTLSSISLAKVTKLALALNSTIEEVIGDTINQIAQSHKNNLAKVWKSKERMSCFFLFKKTRNSSRFIFLRIFLY